MFLQGQEMESLWSIFIFYILSFLDTFTHKHWFADAKKAEEAAPAEAPWDCL